ncbi:MAG TPA: hypothetical protein VIE65_02380 [Methylobacter sp.]
MDIKENMNEESVGFFQAIVMIVVGSILIVCYAVSGWKQEKRRIGYKRRLRPEAQQHPGAK